MVGNDEHTKLLLHMDGSQGGTTWTEHPDLFDNITFLI